MAEHRVWSLISVLACALVFHSPDGTELVVQSDTIKVIKSIGDTHRVHVVPGTNTVLYVGVRSTGFGIHETVDDVMRMIQGCEQNPTK